MKALPLIAVLASLAIFSCENSPGGKDLVKVAVSETKEAKTLSTVDQQPSIIPNQGQFLEIIIQDVDTAYWVRTEDGSLKSLCDAVYHDPKVPWGNGKTMVALKGGKAYVFIIIQDRDAALRLTKTELPLDAAARLVDNPDGSFGVRGIGFDDSTTRDFNSND